MSYFTYSEILEHLFNIAWIETPFKSLNEPVPHGTLVYMREPQYKGDYKGAVNLVLRNAAKYLPAEWFVYQRTTKRQDILIPAISYVRHHARFFQELKDMIDLEDLRGKPTREWPWVFIEGITNDLERLNLLAEKLAGRGDYLSIYQRNVVIHPDEAPKMTIELEATWESMIDFDGRPLRQNGYGDYVVDSMLVWDGMGGFNQSFLLRSWHPQDERPEDLQEVKKLHAFSVDMELQANAILGEDDEYLLYHDNDYHYAPWQKIASGMRSVEISEEEALRWEQQCAATPLMKKTVHLNGPCRILGKKEAKTVIAQIKKQEHAREVTERKMIQRAMRIRKEIPVLEGRQERCRLVK